jgi:hypothetical protein
MVREEEHPDKVSLGGALRQRGGRAIAQFILARGGAA